MKTPRTDYHRQYGVFVMGTKLLLEYAMIAYTLIGVSVLCVAYSQRLLGKFLLVAVFLGVSSLDTGFSTLLLFFRKQMGIEKQLAYNLYYYSYTSCEIVEHILLLVIIYEVFRRAMQPMQGLQRAGRFIFGWVFAVSLAVTLALAMSPNQGPSHFAVVTGQVEECVSVLTICLLLFVTFATRYLGLTYRSHLFGISLGLGIFGATSLVEAAWFATKGAQSVYSPVYLVSAVGGLIALSVWGIYFAMPEPVRELVMLPTTSPYFHWNNVSEALGSRPGHVAVSGFQPEMMAAAELLMLRSASEQVRKRAAAEAKAKAMQEAAPRQPIAMQR